MHLTATVNQRHHLDVGTEGAIAVMVLTVDVGGDRTAHRDHAGARCHRHEPAVRHEGTHHRVEARASADMRGARCRIEFDAVHRRQIQDRRATGLSGIAIGAAESSGEDAPRTCVADRCTNVVDSAHASHDAGTRCRSSPAGQGLLTFTQAQRRIRAGRIDNCHDIRLPKRQGRRGRAR